MKRPLQPYVCGYKRHHGFILCLHSSFISHLETDTLMLKVSKASRYIACVKYCTMNNNQRHVKGVKASSTDFNLLCMFKVLKWYLWLLCNTVYRVQCTQHTEPLALQKGRLPAPHPMDLALHQSEEAVSF